MGNNIYWLLELSIKEGELENLKNLIIEMSDATRSDEPGALIYEWFVSDDGKQCHIYERYSDCAALMIHLGNFGAKFADRFLAILTPQRMTVYGEPTDEVRTALAGFGAVHMAELGGFAR
jgi:quinol monooxygenase YgiN